jgi:hypothetical protein
MRYLAPVEVIRINEKEVGTDLLADFGLLEAAVLRPQQTGFGADAYPDDSLEGGGDDALADPEPPLPRWQQAHCSAVGDRLL